MAATGNNVWIPEDLLARLQTTAAATGRSADELAAEAIREQLRERSWLDLVARGQERGRISGIREDEVPDIVEQYRAEHRGRA